MHFRTNELLMIACIIVESHIVLSATLAGPTAVDINAEGLIVECSIHVHLIGIIFVKLHIVNCISLWHIIVTDLFAESPISLKNNA